LRKILQYAELLVVTMIRLGVRISLFFLSILNSNFLLSGVPRSQY
jgi:hypothetical protein